MIRNPHTSGRAKTDHIVPGYGYRRVADPRGMEVKDDAYQMRGKLPEPTVCPQCHAVFREGRWAWGDTPSDAHQSLCPACRRTNDQFPAGFVTLEGEFFRSHANEIMQLVRNVEQREKAEHPLKRVMGIDQDEDSAEITTTDIHLARGIGDAVHDAYQGELDLHYNEDEYRLRVYWSR